MTKESAREILRHQTLSTKMAAAIRATPKHDYPLALSWTLTGFLKAANMLLSIQSRAASVLAAIIKRPHDLSFHGEAWRAYSSGI